MKPNTSAITRCLCFLLALMIFSAQVIAADITFTQSIDGGIDTTLNSTNRTAQYTNNITAGAVLLACFSTFNNNPANLTLTDDKSNTWTSIGSVYDGNSRGTQCYYATANAGSVGAKPIITFGKAGSSVCVGDSIYELANVNAAILDGAAVTGTGLTTGPAQVTLGSTAFTNDVIFASLGIEQASYVTATELTNYTASISNTNTTCALQHKTITRATTSTGAYTPGWSLSIIAHWNVVGFALKGNTSLPAITSVSAGPWLQGASIVFTGVNFGASQLTGHVNCGVSNWNQSVTAWSNTSITITADKGKTQYGTEWDCTATNDGGQSSSAFTGISGLTPPSGYAYVNIGTPNATASKRLTTSSTDLSSGDQCEYQNATAVVATDATWKNTVAAMPFSADCWNATASAWGTSGVQSYTAPVVTANPAAFSHFSR